MKPCPFCGSTNAKFEPFSPEVKPGYVVCDDCHAFGPSADTEAEAVDAWDAAYHPRVVPAANHDLTLTVDGTDYMVSFMHVGPATFVGITWLNKQGRRLGTYGAAYCNPKDVFDPAVGEKIAMKKACGVGLSEYQTWVKLNEVYRAYRKMFWEKDMKAELDPFGVIDAEKSKA